MSNVLLFGEPMALLIANTTGPLEGVETFTRAMSGAEVNVCIGLSRLGHRARYLSRLGDDPFGHYIQKALQDNHIDTSAITWDPVYRTGIQLKNRVDDGSDPYAPYYRKGSAASHISPAEIDALDLDDIDLIHVTGIPPALSQSARAASLRLMERARENGITLTFDPNLRPSLWEDEETMKTVIHEMASKADYFLPGIEECRRLSGLDSLEDFFDFYESLGAKTVIIKDGSNGAFFRQDGEIIRIPGFPVEEVVDTVGAGDGFAAGVLSGLLEHLPLFECVRRGNAIGSIQITSRSDNEALPMRDDLMEYMNRVWVEPEEMI